MLMVIPCYKEYQQSMGTNLHMAPRHHNSSPFKVVQLISSPLKVPNCRQSKKSGSALNQVHYPPSCLFCTHMCLVLTNTSVPFIFTILLLKIRFMEIRWFKFESDPWSTEYT